MNGTEGGEVVAQVWVVSLHDGDVVVLLSNRARVVRLVPDVAPMRVRDLWHHRRLGAGRWRRAQAARVGHAAIAMHGAHTGQAGREGLGRGRVEGRRRGWGGVRCRR